MRAIDRQINASGDACSTPFPFCEIDERSNAEKRAAHSQNQLSGWLFQEYLSEHYMIRDKRAQLAESLGLSEAQVKTWFQNRRAKDKREKKSDSPHSPTSSADVSVKEERLDTSVGSTIYRGRIVWALQHLKNSFL
ncbi:unnamed protein product [Cylicostephanus goldi]|uniref:Homeobox domain-containing protein n=1 Tax=Cylicostephanus goldi TaxID=71465 RepID=A0A3P7MWV4_CYLGO|nr:unnamed protein product [Cylicostephanus goldi]